MNADVFYRTDAENALPQRLTQGNETADMDAEYNTSTWW